MLTETQPQQLLDEARNWIDHLVPYVQNINELKNTFYKWAAGKSDHDVLVQIEHYHNQFHIQLINIHDLKHEIKHHLKEAERHPTFGHRIPHHHMKEKLDLLENDINRLEDEFHAFIKQ